MEHSPAKSSVNSDGLSHSGRSRHRYDKQGKGTHYQQKYSKSETCYRSEPIDIKGNNYNKLFILLLILLFFLLLILYRMAVPTHSA